MLVDEQRIHIALLLGSRQVPCWQYEMIKQLLAIPQLHIVIVLLEQSSKPSYCTQCLNIVSGVFSWVEKRVSGWQGNARRPVDWQLLLTATPMRDTSDTATRQAFLAADVDLVIDLQGSATVADYCFATSSGQVWRYFYDGCGTLAAEQAGVKEYAAGADGLISGVLSLDSHDKQHCLLQAVSGVDRPLFTQNVDQMLWKMTGFLPFLLQQIPLPLDPLSLGAGEIVHDPVRKKGQGKSVSCKDILSLMKRSLYRASQKLGNKCLWQSVEEQWILLLGPRSLLQQPQDLCQLPQLTPIIPPPDRFWADPFWWHEAGRDYLFFEELLYQQSRGRLVCMEVLADGRHSEPQVVLEKPYHLSYPFLFRYRGDLYMIPESAENHTLDLYRCEQFPQQWTRVKTIMN